MKPFLIFSLLLIGSISTFAADFFRYNDSIPKIHYYKGERDYPNNWDTAAYMAECNREITKKVKQIENKNMLILRSVGCGESYTIDSDGKKYRYISADIIFIN